MRTICSTRRTEISTDLDADIPDPIVPPLSPADRLDLFLLSLDTQTTRRSLRIGIRIMRRTGLEVEGMQGLVDPCAEAGAQLGDVRCLRR